MSEPSTAIEIGPEHDGVRMSLEEFSDARGRPGYLYELEKGVIVVVDIPGMPHQRVVEYVRDEVAVFRRAHPRIINYVGGAAEAKLQLPEMQSERHPDLSIYLNPPPTEDAQPWDEWVPDIVIEVVSASSERRDYEIKPPEYHKAGVKLYWIFDPFLRRVIALRRRGDSWRKTVLEEGDVLTTPLTKGFELRISDVFAAGS